MDRLPEYIALAVALHGVALIICNLTPTPKDDAALGSASLVAIKLYRVLELVAGIVTPLAKR